MTHTKTAHPPIATQDEWRDARTALLAEEKALTRERDRVNAKRRRLPMVQIDTQYLFDGPEGKKSLTDLFGQCRQLIVYHFMFDPAWDEGCPGCTGFVDALGDLSTLAKRETSFVLVSRAPLAKLKAYKAERGWHVPWYSSFGSKFNADFHVTLDEQIAPVEYNYRDKTEIERRSGKPFGPGEAPGISVFFRTDDALFHTYSSYARGVEGVTDAYSLLDLTPYGRQEDWEASPAGWPQMPTYGGDDDAGTSNLVVRRVFDAPLARVWDLWVLPAAVMRWWGPDGFTSPRAQLDFRVGGTSLVCMHAPPELGSQDYYSTWTYTQIDPQERIEYRHSLSDKDGLRIDPTTVGMPADFPQDQRHVVTFRALGPQTTEMTVTEHAWPAGHLREMAALGLEQCLRKMALFLAESD